MTKEYIALLAIITLCDGERTAASYHSRAHGLLGESIEESEAFDAIKRPIADFLNNRGHQNASEEQQG